ANLPESEEAKPITKQGSTQQTCNVKLVSQVGGAFYAADVQGNYAYLGMGSYLAVLDISNPSNPRLLSRTGPFPDIVRGIAVFGEYAYVADGKNGGLRIISVSSPTSPVEVGSYDTPGSADSVKVYGDYAYLIDNGYVRIVNITNPASPYEVGSYAQPTAVDMAVVGNYAYVAGYDGLHIINVGNPEIPREVGFYASYDSKSVAVSGDYAYILSHKDTEHDSLQIINVSDPTQPAGAGSYSIQGSLEDIVAEGDLVYIADGTEGGLWIIDVADPAHATEVSFYDTPGFARNVTEAGNYLYLGIAPAPSDSSRLKEMNGLLIIDITIPTIPRETGAYTYTAPNFVRDVVVVDDYAYIGAEGGLYVLDVTTPLNPVVTGFHTISGSVERMTVAGDYAYIT
ncbi:MAG: LVIVD repeat-containing protein, partial [Anaerolineae bacterium]